MAKHVAGPVHAGTFAVPEREDAVMLALAKQFRLLRTPAGSRRQLLIEARLEDNAARAELLPRLPQLQVEAAQRRAAIAGDKSGSVEPGTLVALALHHQQAHHRLRARQENTLLRQVELVVQRNVVKCHCGSSAEPRVVRPAWSCQDSLPTPVSQVKQIRLSRRLSSAALLAQGFSQVRHVTGGIAGQFRIGIVERSRHQRFVGQVGLILRRGHRRLDLLDQLSRGVFQAD